MGLYKSNDIPVRQKASDRLFYDTYRWCVSFGVRGASVLRGGVIDRDYISKTYMARYHSRIWIDLDWEINYGGKWQDGDHQDQHHRDIDHLYGLAQLLDALHDQGKTVVSSNMMWHYSNDWEAVETLVSCDWLIDPRVSEAVVSRPRDTVVLNESKYSLRSYFREMPLTTEAQDTLKKYLLQQHQWRLAPSLSEWTKNAEILGRYTAIKPQYLRPHWFIDHDSHSNVLLWNMIVPRIIRRTVPIVKVNN